MDQKNQEYIEKYFRENAKFSREELEKTLRSAGYTDEDIRAAGEKVFRVESETKNTSLPVEIPEEKISDSSNQQLSRKEDVEFSADIEADKLLSKEDERDDESRRPPVGEEVIEGSKEFVAGFSGAPVVKNMDTTKHSLLAWLLGGAIVVVALGGGAVLFLENRPEIAANTEAVKESDSISEGASSDESLSKNEMSTSPDVRSFAERFLSGSYRVVPSGIVSYEKGKIGEKTSIRSELSGSTFFVDRGILIRADRMNEGKMFTTIVKNGKVFLVHPDTKTFYEYLETSPEGMIAEETAKDSLVLLQLLEETVSGSIVWDRISEKTWKTEWHWGGNLTRKLFEMPEGIPVSVKVLLDMDGNLSVLALQFSPESDWQEVNFRYEPLSEKDEMLRFPLDYRKQN